MKILTSFIFFMIIICGFVHIYRHYGIDREGNIVRLTFSGKIKSLDTSCLTDGICTVNISDKEVVLLYGGKSLENNKDIGLLLGVDNIEDLEKRIGHKAEVYATTTENASEYTIYGDRNYFVKVY